MQRNLVSNFLTGLTVLCLCSCKSPAQPSNSSGAKARAGQGGSDAYADIAAIVKANQTPIKEFGDACRDLVWSDAAQTKAGGALPTTLGGIFAHFEARSKNQSSSCEPSGESTKCEIRVSRDDSFLVKISFEMKAQAIIATSVRCAKAG